MTSSSVGHAMPDGKPWEFDASVAAVFDDMLERSIPGLVDMRRIVDQIAELYLSRALRARSHAITVDLGASRGGAVAELIRRYGARCQWVLIERAPAMLEALRERFGGMVVDQPGRVLTEPVAILPLDLRSERLPVRPDLVLSVLTLQFLPVEYRLAVLHDVSRSLRPGGALIVVEKTTGRAPYDDELLVAAYWQRKVEAGYTRDDIVRKALALEGQMVPLSTEENERQFAAAGFESAPIWRSLQFAAWVCWRRGEEVPPLERHDVVSLERKRSL